MVRAAAISMLVLNSTTLAVPPHLRGSADVTKQQAEHTRVTHFALVVTGSAHGSERHQRWYWSSNQRICNMLQQTYGYSEQAVYRFHEEGRNKDPAVDGQSTLANIRRAFKHLSEIMEEDDRLLVYLVGHAGPSRADYVYDLVNGHLTATELGKLLDALPSQNVVLLMSPCFSGGFIASSSSAGRVICTSTMKGESNSAGWEGYMTSALAGRGGVDANDDGRVSIKEAYNVAVDGTVNWYRKKNRTLGEHPLLDDNGDGIGHFGKALVVEGDGALASKTYLGADGGKLRYDAQALSALKQANKKLKLE